MITRKSKDNNTCYRSGISFIGADTVNFSVVYRSAQVVAVLNLLLHFCHTYYYTIFTLWIIMPDINIDAIDVEERQFIASYVPGYDWVPGKFGPPPGIPKTRKEQLGMY